MNDTNRKSEAPSSMVMKEHSIIPSPPPIKRVVRCHNVFSLDDRARSIDPDAGSTVGVISVVHQESPLPSKLFPRPMVASLADAYPLSNRSLEYPVQQRQVTNLEQTTEVSYHEYYSMDGYYLGHQDRATSDTWAKSPLVFPVAFFAVIVLLIGVFMVYQAQGSSDDKV